MSRRYDGGTTTFSPEGRLYQVEYALEAISQAGATLGILCKDGVVLAAEKKVTNELLDKENNISHSNISSEKMFKLDNHAACAVAGLTSDANILINYIRVSAQRHLYTYQEPVPVQQLIQQLCDVKQGYTQYGGQRPFGVSFLFAGWDVHDGFQLYHSDPSGNYSAWKAHAVGGNSSSAVSLLKQDWNDNLDMHQAILLALKVLAKSMDSTTLSPEKLELSHVTLDGTTPKFTIMQADELEKFLAEAKEIQAAEDKEKERKEKEKEKGKPQ
eukprot:NODE_2798_length_989_cov_64.598608_g2778_i0.p1 GENE.NODE_2798_length_989_cov_64.598608_g2778_i0~~NODE_2798_length_989_cov_64.598608_g2778_i0.p1  ORF type:complete len:271 (-),score=84.52 NODE_2798_length_989_cov_64.598608_g2778_i0:102-914(-)